MKSLTRRLWFEVPNRMGLINITGAITDLVRKSGLQEGLCLVNAMHITALVFINDAESGLLRDHELWLDKRSQSGVAGTFAALESKLWDTCRVVLGQWREMRILTSFSQDAKI
jgi:hypothetical protein